MKKVSLALLCALVLLSTLALTASIARAGSALPEVAGESVSAPDVMLGPYIPVQGRLTDASGNPLNGDYTITFTLYGVLTGGTELCHDTNNLVHVDHGLFYSEICGNCKDVYTGQQLYLGIQVGADDEMTPRQKIDAVPYALNALNALSLVPGASIIGSKGSDAILHIENSDPTGRGLRAYATSTTGVNYGVIGASKSPDGFGGYFYDNYGGVGLKAESDNVAIKATGKGVIQSSAQSTVWVSGNGLRPDNPSEGTVIGLDAVGGAWVQRGTTHAGARRVVLPITINGTLYGQNVKVVALDVYFRGETATDLISVLNFRRQTETCFDATSCAVSLIADTNDHACATTSHPQGCTQHYNITSNNILSADSGILLLDLVLNFSSDTSLVQIGGVKLTLEHD